MEAGSVFIVELLDSVHYSNVMIGSYDCVSLRFLEQFSHLVHEILKCEQTKNNK
jgi:hypothetical protein